MRDCPLSMVTAAKLKNIRDAKAKSHKRAAANNRLKSLSAMFGWGIEAGHVQSNPCRDVRRIKYSTNGFHTWSVAEVRQFEERHPIGTKARLALALMLFLGVRRSDMVRLGPSSVHGDGLRFIPQKTRYSRNDESEKPILSILADIIAASPIGEKTFLETSFGKAFTANGFGNWFADRCKEAGVPGRAHGLRKAGATILAENGATTHQLMAIFDWSTPAQAEVYTRAANRKRLTAQAMPLLTKL